MKQTITEAQFIRDFQDVRPNNFSYQGLITLFEWLECYEEDTGEEIEFDIIGLCCDFTEYDDLKDFQDNYGSEYQTAEDIEDQTILIYNDYGNLNKGFIIQNF